ncbi:ribonucleotide-diphosphate reductase subunit beta [Metabacillus arenae]|uniref:Ribonucleoside-diphosphate reductase subunit beta n=1 Tax=Metabacillus arenae TaxID=2771434 RepID=A0A926RVN4_9BACI|nr:ribonucleotide-diphosphate reductase subunit beta [Metabacillus arenae]MBD1379066.1 ribonucleotide-diphosphate reductase subunit beta [Metabacillus arenae]
MLKLEDKLKVQPLLAPEFPNKATSILNGDVSGILSWNDIRNDATYERYKELLSRFWTPFEINMSDDAKQWKQFTEQQKETFLKINGLVAILDSVQPRFFSLLIKYISDTAVQAKLIIAMQQEVIHNHSYSYIMSSIEQLTRQNLAFEMARTEKPIYERNKLITEVYENLEKNPTVQSFVEALVASMALEGINFYSAFAYFYNLARNQKMLKTSSIISYINIDELVHTKVVGDILNDLINDNPRLFEHVEKFSYYLFKQAVEKEIEWSEYILKNEEDIDMYEMKEYIKYRANKCLSIIGIKPLYEDVDDNPMPWIRSFSEENIDMGKSDFFEQKSRQYTKVSDSNGFDDL